ncbi:hypothetical protein O6H91_05G106900 [Diphasiastrum complanatum]|uniref:Uncharacterized protein n=1 Tax=Diphasiastrum complanatum TaxID=34168 RepID=A0ACC2DRQ2_DIPCM|nr:hypothetical protein O6H91_05G106900 [Diphasiastrum complanatum]
MALNQGLELQESEEVRNDLELTEQLHNAEEARNDLELTERLQNAEEEHTQGQSSEKECNLPSPTNIPGGTESRGKVCILTVDGGGMRGIIPGRVLAYLEECLQRKSDNPEARIVDFFDVASGTSVGGLITTMLFTSNEKGRPLFTGEDTWRLVAEKGKKIFKIPPRQWILAKLRGIITPRYSTKYMERVLQEHLVRDGRPLTLRDTLKPILIPCYDLGRAGPFLFSRSDAMDGDERDFRLWEICRATSAVPSFFKPVLMSSMDGSSTCTAVDGGLVMNNPTAATIAHVLHNKAEFPGAAGVSDLLVLSLGTGQFDRTYEYKKVRSWGAFQWAKPVVKIVLDGISDMVDHTISMSFGEVRQNYVRVQVWCNSTKDLS